MCCVKGNLLAYSRSQHTQVPLQTSSHTSIDDGLVGCCMAGLSHHVRETSRLIEQSAAIVHFAQKIYHL